MSWGEALRLTTKLAGDPSSQLGASLNGWDHPVTYELIVAMDDFDLKHQIAWAQGGGKGSRPKPYPRPWPSSTKSTLSPAPEVTQEQVLAALRYAGHQAPVPTR